MDNHHSIAEVGTAVDFGNCGDAAGAAGTHFDGVDVEIAGGGDGGAAAGGEEAVESGGGWVAVVVVGGAGDGEDEGSACHGEY